MSSRDRALALTILAAAALVACDGTGGPVLVPDAGADAGDAARDGGTVDAPPPDDQRPTIVATEPEDGARGVAESASIAVTFSERMADAGTITATADGAPIALGAASWDESGTTITVTPAAPLPSESRVRVTLDDDFADVAGNTLALPYGFTFDVADLDAPVVTGSDPVQGASGVSARLDAITISFDEPMDLAAGTPTLSGGAGTIGTPDWIDVRTLRLPLEGLAYGATYEVALDGFADVSGNALDATEYLVDGAISFSTGADDELPRVVESVPSEGQVNVALRGTPSVVLVFDEPMDTTAGTATLHALGGSTVLAGTWSDGGRRLTLPIAGRLYPAAAHSVELAGFRDASGNALDPVPHLGDGRLDFDTGADATVPVVVFSYPHEGSTDADYRLARIEVAFDRAMDTSTSVLRLDDGVTSFDAPVTWNLAGTRAYLDVTDRIHAGRSHRLDLRGMVDLAGDPVDPDAPYLGDGVLDFETVAPLGEQCRDELRITEATGSTPSGGYEWVIPETSLRSADNGPACIYPSVDSRWDSYSPDAVILYRKTSAAGSSGGRYLHVSVDSPTVGDRVTLAVYRDVCGQMAPGGPAGRVACQWDRYRWEQYLDVGAGDYYVWVASVDTALQDRLTVRIEEVDAVPAGESCAHPYTADPSSPVYTAPATAGGEHVWTIPADAYQAPDMGEPTVGAAVCDADQVQGTDFVIRFDKASADTLISAVVEGGDGGLAEVNAEALSICDPRAGGAISLACETGIRPGGAERHGPRRMTFEAPAGPVYLWVANHLQRSESLPASVRIQEFDRPGSSCADALPIGASGTIAIAPSSPARLDVPSCMQPDNATGDNRNADGITWYRLTATQVATVLRTDVAGAPANVGAIALVDASSGRELACAQDATQIPMLGLLPSGSGDICVAVRNSSGITQLDLQQVAYSGVMGRPTDLGITRPLNASGTEVSILGDQWMVATPTTLYMALTSSVLIMPIAGGARADQRTDFTTIGNGGLAMGEAVWSLDDLTTAGTTSRLQRLVSPTGAWGATPWDIGTSWPADGFDAIAFDGTDILVANDYASTSLPVQLRRFAASAAGASSPAVTIHDSLRNVVAIAADATWLFVAGDLGATGTDGVYRIRLTELGTGAPERIAAVPIDGLRTAMFVDATTTAQHLYVRDDGGDVHVVVDPGGATPRHLGALSTLGGTSDYAMAYSPVGPSIYLFETETVTTGNFVRLD